MVQRDALQEGHHARPLRHCPRRPRTVSPLTPPAPDSAGRWPGQGRARAALEGWRQFDLGWVEAWPKVTPIRPGEAVAVVARAAGLWWLNAGRIVYAVDEAGPVTKFGFAYGTLPDHVGSGEERFLIEWDRGDKSVWYDILAFSRPPHLLARLGYPMVHRTQKRFGRESGAAMIRAVGRVASLAWPREWPGRTGDRKSDHSPLDEQIGSKKSPRADVHSVVQVRKLILPLAVVAVESVSCVAVQ
jgi:uncharacterized protein (UPF0548 family)